MALQNIIEVNSRIAGAEGSALAGFGATLFVTADDTQDLEGSGSVDTYRSLSALAEDFGSATEPYKAAAVYFAQSPYPKPFTVARWETTQTSWVLSGATTDILAVASLVGVAKTLIINGVTTTVTVQSGVTTEAAVAAAWQTALRAQTEPGFSDATFTYETNKYVLTFGTDADGRPVEMGTPTGTLTPATTGLNLAGGTLTAGVRGLDFAGFISNVRTYDDDWYFICVDDDLVDTSFAEDISEWTETVDRMAALDTHDADVFDATPAGVGADIADANRQRTFLVYSPRTDYKAVSVAARFSAVNFNGTNSIITGKFKTLPSTVADDLSSDEIDDLDDLSINHYTNFGSTPILAEGVTAKDNVYIDVRYWVDWFVTTVRTEVFNLLVRSQRVPQTDVGLALIKDAVLNVCETGRQNGGIAPGTVSSTIANDIRTATGASEFDGTLTQGYHVHIPSAAQLTDTQLSERSLPTIRVWLKGSGAIHSVDIDITFN